MLRLAVNQLTTFRWTLEQDLDHYRTAGMQGIGVWRPKITDYDESHGLDLVFDSGLEVSSLQWIGGFTGCEGNSFEDSIRDGIEAIELAASIRANCLTTYTGSRGGHTRSHAYRLATNAIRELADAAFDLDVTLGIEPMHPGCGRDWTFLNSIDDALRFLDHVGRSNVQLVFDAYHFGDAPNILSRIPSFARQVTLVQLGDRLQEPHGEQDRLPLGSGILPLPEIIQCLQESGYDGFYEVELIGQSIEGWDYRELLWQSRDAVQGLAKVC